MPLLAESSNRIAGCIGSLIDANTKMRERLDGILGSEPPATQPQGQPGLTGPEPTQGAALIQQTEMLAAVLNETHRQVARLSAI